MDKDASIGIFNNNRLRWTIVSLFLCLYVMQAAAEPLASHQNSKRLQAGEVWALTEIDQRADFLQVQNAGFDTVARALDSQGTVLTQSATWRGSEGRYLLALTNSEGVRASSVEVHNLDNRDTSGYVTISWFGNDSGGRKGLIARLGLYNLAAAGNLHSSHSGEDVHAQVVTHYERSLSAIMASEYADWAADIYFELGVVHRHMHQLDKAESSNLQALSVFHSLNNNKGMAAANNALGLLALRAGQRERAIGFFNEDLRLRSAAGDHFFEARSYNNIAMAYWESDNYPAAAKAYARALPLFAGRADLTIDQVMGLSIEELSTSGALAEIANTLNNLALAKSSLGEVDTAEALWLHAIRIARFANNPMQVAFAELNLGKMLQAQGRLGESLGYLDSAISVYSELNNTYWLGEALIGIGNVYASVNEHIDAVSYYQRALDLNLPDQQQRANSLAQMAKSNWALGHIDSADNQFTEAYASFINGKQPGSAAIVLSKHAVLLYDLGQYERSLANQELAIKTLAEIGQVRETARAQSRLGQLLLKEGQLLKAEQLLKAALQGHQAVSDQLYELDTLTTLSYAQKGSVALDTAQRATELAMIVRTQSLSLDIQTSFVASRRNAFAQYIHLLIDSGYTEKAWLVNEQVRARSLLDLIESNEQQNQQLVEVGLPIRLQVLQETLDDNVAMLSYFLSEQGSHLWVINKDELTYHSLPAATHVNSLATELTQVLRSQRQSMSRISYIAGQLSDMILQPALESIQGRELVVIADGNLQLVPFALLPVNAHSDISQILVEENTVTYSPSAKIFTLLDIGSKQSRDNILVLADPLANDVSASTNGEFSGPQIDFSNMVAQRSLDQSGINLSKLPGAQLEAAAIKHLVESSSDNSYVTIMSGAEASHNFVMQGGLHDYGLIHFATHGVVDANIPALSGLVLADDQRDRAFNYLRPDEIASLDLTADLVVLSGCETGVGKSIVSEGLLSLSRPFLVAGARQVISSLWQVSDRATAQLMERFYFHLLQENKSPEQALRSAQQWLSEQAEWEHPYFWAGFILQGGRYPI